MKTLTLLLLCIFLVTGGDEYKFKNEARKLVKEFGSKLKKELVKGLKNGGPENAVDICKIEAPEIASGIAKRTGWQIGRTSLKTRNSKNKPDKWEAKVFKRFEILLSEGKDLKNLEIAEIVQEGNKSYFRYMKPIITGGVCLQCHGKKIKPDVLKKIKSIYPDDKATGFESGDIRGAFTLKKLIRANK